MFRLLAVVQLVVMSADGAAVDPAPVSSKWTVDFADDHCQASRTYQINGKPVQFAIKPPLDEGTTRLFLGMSFRELGSVEPTVGLDFSDGRPPFRTTMLPALNAKGFVMVLELPQAETARLRQASVLRLKTSSKVRGDFDMGPTRALFEAIDRCLADLRNRVGLGSGPVPWTQPAIPITDLRKLFSWTNFWTVDRRMPKTSQISVRLLIDKAGAVRDCSITAASGSAGLDILTCQAFERQVKYRAATAADGRPVASIVNQTIDWRL